MVTSKMCCKSFLIIYFVFTLVKCENGRQRKFAGRQGRLFSFNTLEDDLSIDVQFSIPFIRIPVKKTMESAYGLMELPTININPASLALGGAVVIGTGVLIPYLLKNYAQQDFRYSRLLDNTEFGADAVIDFAEQMLSKGQGFRGCPLRIACWTAQRDFAQSGVILNQIVSNRLLSTMVNSSAIEDAMLSGRHGRDCMEYGPCPLQEKHIPMLFHKLSILTNPQGYQ